MSRRVKQLLLLAALVNGPACALDVVDVHERALLRAPLISSAEAASAEQRARLANVSAQLGPQVEAEWQRVVGEVKAQPTALQLSQVLLDAPRWRSHSAEQHRLAARVADQAHVAQQLRQDSARLYVQWHAQAQLVSAQRQLAQAYADEAARMGIRHREGLAAAVDWRQSQSYQWLTEANARGAEQQLRALRQALVAHAGDPALLDAPLAPLRRDALPPPVSEVNTTTATAPRLAALQRERDARDDELTAARRAGWPQLRVQVQAQRDLQFQPRHINHELRLQLTLPLWDSGVISAGRDAAQARRLAADASLQSAEREQQRELATQWERLQSAREQYATAQGALTAAAQTVAAMRVGQEQGSRSTSDVLLALQTESQLRQLMLVAQSSAWLAWIDWLVAKGCFDDVALRTLNNVLEPV